MFLLSRTNFKVFSDICGSIAYIWSRTVVIDTGIAKSATPPGSEDAVSPQPNIRVKLSNGSSLGIEVQVYVSFAYQLRTESNKSDQKYLFGCSSPTLGTIQPGCTREKSSHTRSPIRRLSRKQR